MQWDLNKFKKYHSDLWFIALYLGGLLSTALAVSLLRKLFSFF